QLDVKRHLLLGVNLRLVLKLVTKKRNLTNDKFVRFRFFVTSFKTKRRFTPRSRWRFTSNWCFTFTTTVWVIIRVHYRTTNCRTDTHPTATTSFTKVYK